MKYTTHITKSGQQVKILSESWARSELAGRTYENATRANRRLRQRALQIGAEYRAPYVAKPLLKKLGVVA